MLVSAGNAYSSWIQMYIRVGEIRTTLGQHETLTQLQILENSLVQRLVFAVMQFNGLMFGPAL